MSTETQPTPTFDEVVFSPKFDGKLFEALSSAQGQMEDATKDAENPFFKSNYADLASVRAAVREPFAKNKLAVVQMPVSRDGRVGVVTIIGHSSGEWIRGTVFAKPAKDDVQATGSTITYLRRYSLQAVACLATIDDDGEGAMGRDTAAGKRSTATPHTNAGQPASQSKAQPMTEATKKALAAIRATEEGERASVTLLQYWKLVDFDQCSEEEGKKAVKWLTDQLATAKKSATKSAA